MPPVRSKRSKIKQGETKVKQNRKLWLKISMAMIILALMSTNSVVPLTALAASADAPDVTIEWAKLSPMPRARHSGATAVVDGIIYTIGGIEPPGSYKYLPPGAPEGYEVEIPNVVTGTVVEAYDPDSDTWTAKASLPYPPDPQTRKAEGRIYLAAAAYQGKIYTFGGADVQGVVKDTVDVYDIATDTWTAGIAKLPQPVAGMSAVTYGGKIYLFGGSASTDVFAPESYYDDCYEFDPATATFTSKAAIPNPRFKTQAVVFNNKILVFGGASGWGSRNTQIYDPNTDSWDFIESVNWERRFWFGDVVNNMVFLVGGRDEHAKTSSVVLVYSDHWEAWVPATHMLTPREDAFVAAVDGKLYVIGGRDNMGNPSSQGKPLASAERGIPPPAPPSLDLTPPPPPEVTIDWSFVSPMPTPRCYGATALVDNIIYTIGGLESESPTGKIVEAYDPVADKWTNKASMPEGRFNLAAAAHEGKIYTFGGVGVTDNKLQVMDAIDVYDIATDTWTANIAKLPKPAAGMSAVTYGDKIYLFGGCQSPQMFVLHTYYYNGIYEFDPATSTITKKGTMPVARNMASGCILKDKIQIIGGMRSPGATFNGTYSPSDNSWQENPLMPEMRGGQGGVVVEGKAYIIGGRGDNPIPDYEYNMVYDPGTQQWQGATPNEIGRSVAFTAAASASPESIYVMGGIDSKGNVLDSVEKGMVSEAAAPPPPSPEPEPEPSPAPEPAAPPTPSPTPSEGMGCAQASSSLPGESFDFSPFLLGAIWGSLALCVLLRRKK